MNKIPRYVQDICNEAVDSLFEERRNARKRPVTMFTLSGKAKDTKVFSYWFAKITKGLTFAEACAVITTNPKVMQNIQEMLPELKFNFNQPAIRDTLNQRIEKSDNADNYCEPALEA